MATDKTYKVEPLTDALGKPLRLPGEDKDLAAKTTAAVKIEREKLLKAVKELNPDIDIGELETLLPEFQADKDITIIDILEYFVNSMDNLFRAALTWNDLKAISHIRHSCAAADGKLVLKADDWDWLKKVVGERLPPKGAMKVEFDVTQTYGGLLLGKDAPEIDELISEGYVRDPK